VQFPRMGDIFFADQNWNLTRRDFAGKFHLFKADTIGRRVQERPARSGGLPLPCAGRLAALDARPVRRMGRQRNFFGGDGAFSPIRSKPLGPEGTFGPLLASRQATRIADVAAFTDFQNWRGLRFAGSMSGRNLARVAHGPVCRAARPRSRHRDAASGRPADPAAAGQRPAAAPSLVATLEWGPFAPAPLPVHVRSPQSSRTGSPPPTSSSTELFRHRSHARGVRGANSVGRAVALLVHVTSRDWQESDQVLAGLIKDFGSSERRGRLDRRRVRIRWNDDRAVPRAPCEGAFSVRTCAPGHEWGAASGHIVTR